MIRQTILVSGCAGYIGSVATQSLLDAGHKVIGFDSLKYDNIHSLAGFLGHKNFDFHEDDARGYKIKTLAKRADVVIPLAALVGAPLCEACPDEAEQVNFHAVRDLVKTLGSYQRVLYPNTNSGYGATDGSYECTEEDALLPISTYGRTKCQAEEVVLSHMNSVSLRLATVFGVSPRMRFDLMVNDFASRLVYERKLEVFEPHFKRNFVHVRDVVRAFMHMLDENWVGAFNVGLPDANLTKMELAYVAANVVGLSREAITIGEGCDEDKRNYFVSNKKLHGIGFRWEYGLRQGIDEVTRYCRMLPKEATKTMRNVPLA